MFNLEATKIEEITATSHPLEFMALCPFHDDTKVGSFFINIQSGFYHCFNCRASGNIYQLVKFTKGKIQQKRDSEIKHIRSIMDLKWSAINSAPLAFNNQYLNKRNVNNDLVKLFDIRETDNGIAFPLKNFIGMIVGFQERTYSGFPSRYHLWGQKPPFYIYKPIEQYFEHKRLYIVEGIFGVINAYRCGNAAVTFLGASSHDLPTLRLLTNDETVVLYDNDPAGINNAREICKMTNGRIGALLPGCEADEITKHTWDEYNLMQPICKYNEIK